MRRPLRSVGSSGGVMTSCPPDAVGPRLEQGCRHMGFDVYPAPPSAPLTVPAAAAGPLVEVAERVSVDPVTGRTVMIVRVVQVDTADGHSASSPSIRLAV